MVLHIKMPKRRPKDALGTLLKLQNCANCKKYLTLLHCEISELTVLTEQTELTEQNEQPEQTEEPVQP